MSEIRSLERSDIDAVLAITAAAPETAAWKREAYESLLETSGASPIERRWCYVALQEGQVVGFICFRVIGDEAELLNVAVLPAFQRRAVASRLLKEAFATASQHGAGSMFLEVRESNTAALRLYERHGFQPCGRRPGYYANPPSDALVLSRHLP